MTETVKCKKHNVIERIKKRAKMMGDEDVK
jgi:hypothetical protein